MRGRYSPIDVYTLPLMGIDPLVPSRPTSLTIGGQPESGSDGVEERNANLMVQCREPTQRALRSIEQPPSHSRTMGHARVRECEDDEAASFTTEPFQPTLRGQRQRRGGGGGGGGDCGDYDSANRANERVARPRLRPRPQSSWWNRGLWRSMVCACFLLGLIAHTTPSVWALNEPTTNGATTTTPSPTAVSSPPSSSSSSSPPSSSSASTAFATTPRSSTPPQHITNWVETVDELNQTGHGAIGGPATSAPPTVATDDDLMLRTATDDLESDFAGADGAIVDASKSYTYTPNTGAPTAQLSLACSVCDPGEFSIPGFRLLYNSQSGCTGCCRDGGDGFGSTNTLIYGFSIAEVRFRPPA